jgi:hypothetical protein
MRLAPSSTWPTFRSSALSACFGIGPSMSTRAPFFIGRVSFCFVSTALRRTTTALLALPFHWPARVVHVCNGAQLPAMHDLHRIGKDAILAFVIIADAFPPPPDHPDDIPF